MQKLVRGGALTVLISAFAIVIYANAKAGDALIIANDSRASIETEIFDTEFDNSLFDNTIDNTDDTKKLVATTGSSRVASAGTSRGSFSATAYCLRGRTAMGHGVRRGLIAADPRVLKLGSRVTLTGGGYNGSYLVSDTGGRIKGKKIDIWMPSCSEAKRFGRRNIQVSQ